MAKRTKLADQIEAEAVAAPPKKSAVKKNSLRTQVKKTRTRSKSYKLDLRIHSPSSLGYGGLEGVDTAPALVRLAQVKGLDVIAVTDFYSGAFIDRVLQAASDSKLVVVPGVNLRCKVDACDDVVLTCLFAEDFGAQVVNEFLRALAIPAQAQGNSGYVLDLAFESVLTSIEAYGGVAIPSRIDKTPHRRSVIPVLVERYGFRAFDLAYADSKDLFKAQWPKLSFHLFSFSNASALAQVGSRSAKVRMTESGFAGIRELVARQCA